MKRSNIYILSTTILCGLMLLMACEKNTLNLQEIKDPSSGSYFKLGWFSPGLTSQGVQLKVNGVRQSNQLGYGTGFTSTTTYAMPFPGGGLNTGGNNKNDYLSVDTGTLQIAITVPKKGTSDDSIVVLNTAVPVSKGKYYTLIVTDSFPAAKSYVLSDDVDYADSGFIKLNFTNAIANNTAGVDFLVTNTSATDQVLASNVQFKGSTGFLTFPLVVGTNTFKIRKTGTATILGTYATSSVTNKRCFTVVARGYEGATGVRIPTLSLIFNK
jgi:hypothetical protein